MNKLNKCVCFQFTWNARSWVAESSLLRPLSFDAVATPNHVLEIRPLQLTSDPLQLLHASCAECSAQPTCPASEGKIRDHPQGFPGLELHVKLLHKEQVLALLLLLLLLLWSLILAISTCFLCAHLPQVFPISSIWSEAISLVTSNAQSSQSFWLLHNIL